MPSTRPRERCLGHVDPDRVSPGVYERRRELSGPAAEIERAIAGANLAL
jgi:hypothetical protein